MRTNPNTRSPLRAAAHVAGYVAFASAGVATFGAVATAPSTGVLHMAFAAAVVVSALVLLAAIAVHGNKVLPCRFCVRHLARTLARLPVQDFDSPGSYQADAQPPSPRRAA